MKRINTNIVFLIVIVMSCSCIFFLSCKESVEEGMIVYTQASEDLKDIDPITGENWRYISDSQIVVLNPNKTGESKILTEDFFSACSPSISFDGKFMIFAAQKEQNDVWQLWEMNLDKSEVRQITSSTENCIDPAYLPNGRLVFSKFANYGKVETGHALFTCNLDGSNMSQITYNPHTYFASTILRDGRLLAISRQLYPDHKDGTMVVLRPDGTKEELFYQGLKGSKLLSLGYETNNGQVIFIESDKDREKSGNIVSINYNRPLHSKVELSSAIKGDFHSITALHEGKLLVSYRSSDNDTYALHEFDMETKTLGKTIHKDTNYNILEAVVVAKRDRPKKLPSEVNTDVNTGLLLCQNVNFSKIPDEKASALNTKAVSMEVIGIDASLGIVDIENDGSFYLKVLADVPFRMLTIDKNGQVVSGPSSWINLRPNERRGCVGCHENKEQVPENKHPLSIRKEPIILPAQMKEINDIKVLLK